MSKTYLEASQRVGLAKKPLSDGVAHYTLIHRSAPGGAMASTHGLILAGSLGDALEEADEDNGGSRCLP